MRRELNILNPDEVRDIERKLGVVAVRDRALLARAFIAKSAPAEIRSQVGGSNRVLALNGDAITRAALYDFLYNQYHGHPCGLARYGRKFLSNKHMAELAHELKLVEHIRFACDDRIYEAATAYEAVVYVLQRDQPSGAQPFLFRTLLRQVQSFIDAHRSVQGRFDPDDPRFELDVLAREQFRARPRYTTEFIDEPVGYYRALVRVGHLFNMEGSGQTGVTAKQDAARHALNLLRSEVMQQHKFTITPRIRSTGITVIDPSALEPSTNGDQSAAEPVPDAASAS